jgi:DNA-binding MarR family transcriptional regulator
MKRKGVIQDEGGTDQAVLRRQAPPHPTDGRQVNIELTAQGAAVRKSAKDAKRMWLAQAIAQLDEGERETLFAVGRIIKRLVEL